MVLHRDDRDMECPTSSWVQKYPLSASTNENLYTDTRSLKVCWIGSAKRE